CTMTVTFAPSSTGTRPGTLTVSDTDSTSPQTVTLQGNGTNAALSPSLLKFLNTVPGKSSATMTATLTNKAASSLTISSITLSGDYTQSNTCGTSVPAGGSCVFTVTFKPTITGVRFGTITVVDSDGSSPHVLRLT